MFDVDLLNLIAPIGMFEREKIFSLRLVYRYAQQPYSMNFCLVSLNQRIDSSDISISAELIRYW